MSYTKNQIALQTFLANGLIKPQDVDFAKSIAHKPNPSIKQVYWIDRMVKEAMGEGQASPQKVKADLSRIFVLFDNAMASKLKYPKITLQFKDGTPIRMSTSRNYRDSVFVSRGGYGSEQFAKLFRNGEIRLFTKTQERETELMQILTAFAADPEKVAQEYGKLTHNCCYCAKQLDTAESLAVGYGPVCAKHYGLAWGKKVARTTPNVSDLMKGMQENLELNGDLSHLLSDDMGGEFDETRMD
jgi:hypothetical protein